MSDAEALRQLSSATSAIVPEDGLREKLSRGRPLRVKLGLDPTAPAVTLGWAVVLRKLRQFQDLSHTAVLIVGDFTARVGDPSGTSETRTRLSKEVVDGYTGRLLHQFWKILDEDATEVRRNSEWLEPMDMEAILRLTATTTVARMLERDDFAKRFSAQRPISLMEFLYPLLQGYDSVAVEADVELGGTDQLFNLLMGREVQRDRGQEPQVCLTVPLLEGTDGVQKMSQSLGNYVGIEDPPNEMFGKLMSVPDGLIGKYALLCTDAGPEEAERVERELAAGTLHPNDAKRAMARAVVVLYHGAGAAEEAEERFNLVHREREVPADVDDAVIPDEAFRDGRVWLPRLLVATGFASSNAQARRDIEAGAVRLDGEPLIDVEAELTREALAGRVLSVGRRRFVRLA
jgi:tyrosyl-tRNA synthetase